MSYNHFVQGSKVVLIMCSFLPCSRGRVHVPSTVVEVVDRCLHTEITAFLATISIGFSSGKGGLRSPISKAADVGHDRASRRVCLALEKLLCCHEQLHYGLQLLRYHEKSSGLSQKTRRHFIHLLVRVNKVVDRTTTCLHVLDDLPCIP